MQFFVFDFKLNLDIHTIFSSLFLIECSETLDLGFLVDFSGNSGTYFSEIKDFIIETSLLFDINEEHTHFSYLTYSTYPRNIVGENWFDNRLVASVKPGDKVMQREYLDYVIVPEPNPPPSASYKNGKLLLVWHLVKILLPP